MNLVSPEDCLVTQQLEKTLGWTLESTNRLCALGPDKYPRPNDDTCQGDSRGVYKNFLSQAPKFTTTIKCHIFGQSDRRLAVLFFSYFASLARVYHQDNIPLLPSTNYPLSVTLAGHPFTIYFNTF